DLGVFTEQLPQRRTAHVLVSELAIDELHLRDVGRVDVVVRKRRAREPDAVYVRYGEVVALAFEIAPGGRARVRQHAAVGRVVPGGRTAETLTEHRAQRPCAEFDRPLDFVAETLRVSCIEVETAPVVMAMAVTMPMVTAPATLLVTIATNVRVEIPVVVAVRARGPARSRLFLGGLCAARSGLRVPAIARIDGRDH